MEVNRRVMTFFAVCFWTTSHQSRLNVAGQPEVVKCAYNKSLNMQYNNTFAAYVKEQSMNIWQGQFFGNSEIDISFSLLLKLRIKKQFQEHQILNDKQSNQIQFYFINLSTTIIFRQTKPKTASYLCMKRKRRKNKEWESDYGPSAVDVRTRMLPRKYITSHTHMIWGPTNCISKLLMIILTDEGSVIWNDIVYYRSCKERRWGGAKKKQEWDEGKKRAKVFFFR